jgi:hypothetical protein
MSDVIEIGKEELQRKKEVAALLARYKWEQFGMAEKGGFEPPVRFYSYNGLANRRFRPLSHLSGFIPQKNISSSVSRQDECGALSCCIQKETFACDQKETNYLDKACA